MKHIILIITMYCASVKVLAQSDSSIFKRIIVDTAQKSAMNMDAVYNRPFLQVSNTPISIGGYVEADYRYLVTDGITDGHSFRMPRTTLFFSASMDRLLRFLAEIELEEGGKEISIEFASVDIILADMLNVRGGVVMNPIGAFNQNHDGPKWEFVERPISMAQLLPATWSNVGFGIFGKTYNKEWSFGYEAYLTNGFDESIIDNSENRTSLAATKQSKERFDESSNGHMLTTGKVALRNQNIGELGLSYMGGIYNRPEVDGLQLNTPHRVDVAAVDFQSTISATNTRFVGEWAWIWVDVPATYSQQFGNKQHGGFVDIIQPVYKGNILDFPNAVVNVACRLEYVDWNSGVFKETGGSIGEELWSIVPSISFRPISQTVIRLNYRINSQTDFLGNPPVATRGFEFGIASYF